MATVSALRRTVPAAVPGDLDHVLDNLLEKIMFFFF